MLIIQYNDVDIVTSVIQCAALRLRHTALVLGYDGDSSGGVNFGERRAQFWWLQRSKCMRTKLAAMRSAE